MEGGQNQNTEALFKSRKETEKTERRRCSMRSHCQRSNDGVGLPRSLRKRRSDKITPSNNLSPRECGISLEPDKG